MSTEHKDQMQHCITIKKQKRIEAAAEEAVNFPDDLIDNILEYLPRKSLMRFKSVYKQWHSLITSNRFIRCHLTHRQGLADYKLLVLHENTDCNFFMTIHDLVCGRKLTGFPPPTSTFVNYGSIERLMQEKNQQVLEIDSSCSHELLFDMLPSNCDPYQITCCCDGIMCVTLCDRLLLWNPNTDDCKTLPFPDPDDIFPAHKWEAFGFGYVSSADDYKIVNVPSYGSDLVTERGRAISTGENLYWFALFPQMNNKSVLIRFDLDKEICTQLPMPPNVVVLPHSVNLSSLGVLAGCISAGSRDTSNNCFDIWIFKGETWIKHLNFPASIHKGPDDRYISNVIPLFFNDHGALVMHAILASDIVANGITMYTNYIGELFLIYDQRHDTCTKIQHPNSEYRNLNVVHILTPSLVSLST